MKAIPAPGEVWTVDFGYDGKVRSALVVSIPDNQGDYILIPKQTVFCGESQLNITNIVRNTIRFSDLATPGP